MHEALYNLVREHYRELQGYFSAGMEHAKDGHRIFLNANENPYVLPGLEGCNRYPDPQPVALAEGYAALYSVRPDQIVMTRGADESIVVLTKLFCEPHQDSILTCPPTFGIYAVDAHAMPASVIEVPLIKEDGTYKLDVEGIIKAAHAQRPKIIYLCSPNNPTGTAFPLEDMLRIIRETAGISVVVVDETYIEFAAQESLTAQMNDLPNMVILRTLSKSYALAGMRMGTMLCGDTAFIAFVKSKCLDAYPLPRGSIDAALTVMSADVQKIAQKNIRTLVEDREKLKEGFEGCPLVRHVYPSEGNFILVEMDRAGAFVNYCAERDVILRDFSNKPLTQDCIRIAVGLPEENEKLLGLLSDFCG